MRAMMGLAGMLLLAACSSEPAPAPVEEAVPEKLAAGQWEVTAKTVSLRSTDKTTPAIDTKAGDTVTSAGCIGADGVPPAELFAAKGDSCTAQNPYVRNGRVDVSVSCTRKGFGRVMSQVAGKYTADGLTGTVTTNTSFSGSGDYELKQEFTGRRVGECPAKVAGA